MRYSTLAGGAALLAQYAGASSSSASKPNIVVIMSDDQDYRLDSLSAQKFVRDEIMGKGITLENHFATVAQCCPSRTSFLRGQQAHNTNLTHVAFPGGGYEKFVASGQDLDYLPHWLKSAGYRTEYLGKFMNGYTLANYMDQPKGWDYTDVLVVPYVYEFNNVVMSENGQTPVHYPEFHQTDIIRAKALARLEKLADGDEPFYLQIAPASPHTESDGPTMPCIRHEYYFNGAFSPRRPNFNPPDEFQKQKPSWLADLSLLNDTVVKFVDWQYRSRLQGLMGVDEMVEDTVRYLEKRGLMDNTYIIYTSDNGFHLGNHRRIGGKGLPYIEDTNIPMAIRGPGISAGKVSHTPSSHLDMAATFLEMVGFPAADYPPFLDGRSLLGDWLDEYEGTDPATKGSYVAKEVMNVEFWGSIDNAGSPDFSDRQPNNSYKTVRFIGEDNAWLFSRWCENNDTELYNTKEDPYELTNLALDPDADTQRLIDRLNGVLYVTKSCNQDDCRNPWNVLQKLSGGTFQSLGEAMSPDLDDFFAQMPQVGFQTCMDYQDVENEVPYYQSTDDEAFLGQKYRQSTDHFVTHTTNGTRTPHNQGRQGTLAQRHSTLQDILAGSRELTSEEIGSVIVCDDAIKCLKGKPG